MIKSFVPIFFFCFIFWMTAPGAEMVLKVAEQAPPKEVLAGIAATLNKNAHSLMEGEKILFRFWFCSELTLQKKPDSSAKALETLAPAQLLGVVEVPKSLRDYRDDEVVEGVYTLRFALQPQDGNHLGTSEFTYFAVLTPVAADNAPNAISDYKTLVKASSKQTSTEHPVVLSLRPVSTEAGKAPQLLQPVPDHHSVRIQVPAKVAGAADKITLNFELVIKGVAKK